MKQETKNGSNFADYSRYVEISNLDSETPTIREYINEDGDLSLDKIKPGMKHSPNMHVEV
jgi:hypothetical protein